MTSGHALEAGAVEPRVREDEYDALQQGAVLLPHDGVWKSFSGAKAVDVINGLVTQDVATLQPGSAALAVALTPKGKVVADLLVVRTDADRFLVGASGASAAGWHDLVRKYVNPRLATVSDESARLGSWLVAGPQAAAVVARSETAAPADHPGEGAVVARLAVAVPTSMVLIVAPMADASGIAGRLRGAGAVAGSEALASLLRIEAGWPAVGFGMDENTIPQEANLDALGAISFTKGCYTGQETVARVHFRGHVNRHLRGLRLERPVAVGSSLTDDAGKVVGDVRVVGHSPRYGVVALAMVRREVGDGATLVARAAGEPVVDGTEPAGGGIPGRVVFLPFR